MRMDQSDYSPKVSQKLVSEVRRLVSQYVVLEQLVVSNSFSKKFRQEHDLSSEKLILKYTNYGIFKLLLTLYDTQSDGRQNISSESPIILRFEDDELPVPEHKELCKILEM